MSKKIGRNREKTLVVINLKRYKSLRHVPKEIVKSKHFDNANLSRYQPQNQSFSQWQKN